jgi:hypothetical protein
LAASFLGPGAGKAIEVIIFFYSRLSFLRRFTLSLKQAYDRFIDACAA